MRKIQLVIIWYSLMVYDKYFDAVFGVIIKDTSGNGQLQSGLTPATS